MKQVCDAEQCFGCCSCYNICPKNAISMGEDQWGNLIPVIDPKKCVDCGLCQRSCPALNQSDFKTPKKTYAAITKDENDYISTSSGGIATAFSKFVLENNGIVYGAAFIEGTAIVKHIRVTSVLELEKLKGSKYVQSYIDDSFKKVKKDLELGNRVIFIGTPCQIDGLQRFLQNNFENLLTVNLICHGTPSNVLFKEHVEKIIGNQNNLKISFRNTIAYRLKIFNDKMTLYSNEFYKDNYFLGFMRKLFYRNSCYSCKYAQKKRVGDLTIGDFWGFDTRKPFPVGTPNGLSVVLINTEKGEQFFELLKDKIIFQERDLSEAVKGNPNLNHPSKKNLQFNRFRKLYLKYGFEKAAEKVLWKYKIAYLVNFFVQKIKWQKKD